MKAKQFILIGVVLYCVLFLGLPYSRQKAAYADPPEQEETWTAVVFPYVTNAGGFDTTITVGGDTSEMTEAPVLRIYYYDLMGGLLEVKDDYPGGNYGEEGDTWQWIINLSVECPGDDGMYIAFTNIPQPMASCSIVDTGYQHMAAAAPAYVDPTICGIGENGTIIRYEGVEPPNGEHHYDEYLPELREIDPSLHHTTLFFPYVTNLNGYDTGIVITQTYNGYIPEECLVHYFFYNMDGGLVFSWDEDLNNEGDHKFVASFWPWMAGAEGSLIAIVDAPYAQGYELIGNYGMTIFASGWQAVVDNNIFSVQDGSPVRIEEPQIDHTSLIAPYVTEISGFNSAVVLSNTINMDRAVKVDFYLYNKDGTFAGSWTTYLQEHGETGLNESVVVFFNGQILELRGTADPVERCSGITNFEGWLLAVADAPGVHGFGMMANSGWNVVFDGYPLAIQNDITGINGSHEIVRDDPAPITTEQTWDIPLITNIPFDETSLDTAVFVTCTRNLTELESGATLTHDIADINEGRLDLDERDLLYGAPQGPVIPSAGFHASDEGAFPGVLGMGWGKTNFPDTCPLYFIGKAGFPVDGFFVMPPGFTVSFWFLLATDKYLVLPGNGGTKTIELEVTGDEVPVEITIANLQGKASAKMKLSSQQDFSENKISISAKGKYEIIVKSEPKPEGTTWDNWLQKDSVTVRITDKNKVEKVLRLTIFWVIIDVDPNWIHPGPPGQGEPGDKYDWPAAPTSRLKSGEKPIRDSMKESVGSDNYRGGRHINDNWSWGAILVRGKILPAGVSKSDFVDNPSREKGFDWKRWVKSRAYIGNGGDFVEAVPGGTAGRLNVNWAEDEEPEGFTPNADEDLSPDTDGPDNYLYIWSFDVPGLSLSVFQIAGDILRERNNYAEFVFYNGQICSDGDPRPAQIETNPGYKWGFAHSAKSQKVGGVLKLVEENTFNGDNRVVAGSWLNDLSHTMVAGTPSVPFNLTKFGVKNKQVDREKIDFEVILQNTSAPGPKREMKIEGTDFPHQAPTIALEPIRSASDPAPTIGVEASEWKSATELETKFDFAALDYHKPGEYRLKVTIGGISVVLVDNKKKLAVIGRVARWQENDKAPFPDGVYWIVFDGFDALDHPAKGTDAPPVEITEENPPANFFDWTPEGTRHITRLTGLTGSFRRELKLRQGQQGSSKFVIDDKDANNPLPPKTTEKAIDFP